jgi:hypothetical protein
LGLAMWLATAIATLLDPDNKTEQYELVLRRRPGRKGPKPRKLIDNAIGHLLEQRIALYPHLTNRGRMKAAISDVVSKLGVKRTDVYAAWKRYQQRPRWEPPTPGPNVMLPPLTIRPE